MSLAPGERQTLAEIENRLRWSDPRLAARLALFRRHAPDHAGPARESLTPRRAASQRGQTIRLVLIALAVTLALIGYALVSGGGKSHGTAMATCASGAAWRGTQPSCSSPGQSNPAGGTA